MMKSQLNAYFTFSKGQQRGIMLLLTLIVLVSIIYFLLPSIVQSKTIPSNNTLTALMASIEMDTAYESNTHYTKKKKRINPAYLHLSLSIRIPWTKPVLSV
ncbi:hypothetical protein EMGBS15_01390 [Filimonas sp.]|nr:hypothetical protein EMGBS15_01390 [Filimonas sp.]